MSDPDSGRGLWSSDELTPNTVERLFVAQQHSTKRLSNELADLSSALLKVESRLVRAYEDHESRLAAVEQSYDMIGLRLNAVATREDVAELRVAIMSGRNSSLDEDMDIHKIIGELRDRVSGIEGANVRGGAIGGGAGAAITILIAIIAWLLGIELPL